MVLDRNQTIWVAAGGLLQDSVKGALYHIDPETRTLIGQVNFPEGQYPSELSINGDGNRLYYINEGVFVFSIESTELPVDPVISEDGELFYGLGIDPEAEDIYVADAIDFVQRGLILRYASDGNLIDEFRTGIIPGGFYME